MRVLGYVVVLLVAAAVVAWWGVATGMITMDSPFRSFDFRAYAIFSLIFEIVLGLPYAFGVRAVLRWKRKWSASSMWVAALVPGIVVTLFETFFDGKPVFGPCLLLAAVVMAGGWQVLGFDGRAWAAHA